MAEHKDTAQKLAALRAEMRKAGVDAFILPLNDEFMGEYIPDSAKRLEWLTGFSGSYGYVVVTAEKAALFVDGRYTLQAEKQVDGALFEIHTVGQRQTDKFEPALWAAEQLGEGAKLGYDAKLHTHAGLHEIDKALKEKKLQAVAIPNPVDALWHDRPTPPRARVWVFDAAAAGATAEEKRLRMALELRGQKVDAAVIADPASVCWLLNIRGGDVPYTPFALSYAVLYADGKVDLYIDPAKLNDEVRAHLGEDVQIFPIEAMGERLGALAGKKVLYDSRQSSVWFDEQLTKAGAVVVHGRNPCMLPKACKNAAELEGIRAAHRRDGRAVARFLEWLREEVKARGVSEIEAAERLLEFRQQENLFLEPSFATIAGWAANGAIVHYHATPESHSTIQGDGLFLLDSGGQYLDGTTDITRTIAIGTPTQEQKEMFTRVLKGHIAIATAVFPEGTTGEMLDSWARRYLWEVGLDYSHGTGHGVGHCLSVHEGPQSISKRPTGVALLPGMVVSNEPGYYKRGEYGIRIENLVAVVEAPELSNGDKKFFRFETLTTVPLDESLIEWSLLTRAEEEWVKAYNRRCEAVLGLSGKDGKER